MLEWIFGKKKHTETEEVELFHHGDSLTLRWDGDSEGWTCPLPVQGKDGRLFLGAGRPSPQACALMLDIREQISALNETALSYLVQHDGVVEFVRTAHKQAVSRESFRFTGAELFEHYDEGTYSLTYEASFHPGAIWMVHFTGHQPDGWGFDG